MLKRHSTSTGEHYKEKQTISFWYLYLGPKEEKTRLLTFFCALLKNLRFPTPENNFVFFLDIFEISHVFEDLRSFQNFHSFSARFLPQLSKPLFTCTDAHLIENWIIPEKCKSFSINLGLQAKDMSDYWQKSFGTAVRAAFN